MIYSNILNSLRLVHWVEPIDRLRHGVFSFAAAASLLSQVTFFCGTYFSFYQIKSTFFLQSFTQWEMECPITLMAHISKALLRGEAMDHFDEEIPFSLLTWSVLVARGPTKSLFHILLHSLPYPTPKKQVGSGRPELVWSLPLFIRAQSNLEKYHFVFMILMPHTLFLFTFC